MARYKTRVIDCDFETYCEASIFTVGGIRYAQDPTCEVLIFSWGETVDDIETWCPHLDPEPPQSLVELAKDPNVMFQAHNAEFEHAVWKYVMCVQHNMPYIPPERWTCTAARCAAAGLPRALDKVGMVLDLKIKKDKEGSRLIKLFCQPQPARKATKKNPQGVPARRIRPEDSPKEFSKFVSYNRDDVASEMCIPPLVPALTPNEQAYYVFTLEMNDRGLPLDMRAVNAAMPTLTELENRCIARSTELAGGIRPTQRDKMLTVFSDLGLEMENLQAKTLKDILTIRGEDLEPNVKELLMLRLEGGKASTKKLKKMLQVVCKDGRVRGSLLFYGAHTGRYAGKLIQPQNFTRGEYSPEQLEQLFWFLINEDADCMEFLFRRPIDAIAQGMRGFIKASRGKKFVVSDFSAIEARMLAWLAGEQEVLKVYHLNGDVYVRMASALYQVPEAKLLADVKAKVSAAVKMRKFGKDIVLGCGFQMGGPGFYRNCISRGINVEEDFCVKAVKVYRAEHPAIVKFWSDTERCAIQAVKQGANEDSPIKLRMLEFFVKDRWLCVRLPSGRLLRYIDPKVQLVNRFGKMRDQLSFKTEVKGQWIRETTYGGKLVENITQAVARDVMCESMVRAKRAGYECVGTVHDELITEVDVDFGNYEELESIMRVLPRWCPDAPVNAEGWSGARYRK